MTAHGVAADVRVVAVAEEPQKLDALAARKAMLEGSVGGTGAGLDEINNILKRVLANDKKVTELNFNNNAAFAKMSKEQRIAKMREV
jgi:hypothetical protein